VHACEKVLKANYKSKEGHGIVKEITPIWICQTIELKIMNRSYTSYFLVKENSTQMCAV